MDICTKKKFHPGVPEIFQSQEWVWHDVAVTLTFDHQNPVWMKIRCSSGILDHVNKNRMAERTVHTTHKLNTSGHSWRQYRGINKAKIKRVLCNPKTKQHFWLLSIRVSCVGWPLHPVLILIICHEGLVCFGLCDCISACHFTHWTSTATCSTWSEDPHRPQSQQGARNSLNILKPRPLDIKISLALETDRRNVTHFLTGYTYAFFLLKLL